MTQSDKPVAARKDRAASDRENSRPLPPEALCALAEAEARRAKPAPERPREVNGRGGLDPVRYGDWEVKGVASDF